MKRELKILSVLFKSCSQNLIFIYLSAIVLGIHSWAHANISKEPFFTVKQEEFFASNIPVYAYFSEMYVAGKTPEQIAKEYELSENTNLKYLEVLENAGVIEKINKDDLSSPAHFLVSGISSFSQNGPLSTKITELILKEYQTKTLALAKEKSSGFYLSAPGLWLTENEYEHYKKELVALEEKYIDLSIKNKKEKKKEASRVSALMGLIPGWEPTVFNKVEKEY